MTKNERFADVLLTVMNNNPGEKPVALMKRAMLRVQPTLFYENYYDHFTVTDITKALEAMRDKDKTR
jgi:hypothetical protein